MSPDSFGGHFMISRLCILGEVQRSVRVLLSAPCRFSVSTFGDLVFLG